MHQKDPEEALKSPIVFRSFEYGEKESVRFDGGLHNHAFKHISVLIACTVPLSSASLSAPCVHFSSLIMSATLPNRIFKPQK